MHDISSSPMPPASERADTLTQILLGLRLDGVEYGRCSLNRPWSIAFPARAEARFHFVASGACWLRTGSNDWVPLKAGDAVLVPRGGEHVLASAPDVPAVQLAALDRVPVSEDVYLVRADPAHADGEPPDVLFSGALRFNLDPLHPLLAMMPPVMLADQLMHSDPSVPLLLEAMEREVALDRIGACSILARLADVLAASIIRAWVECACNDPTGWIAAAQCSKIGKVIAAIHAEPERDWSVPELAGVMGVSRSRFADAFTRTVGESPARYVAKVKMFQARRWIAQEGLRITVVADRLGYESEASFSRAFKRITGLPPSALRGDRSARQRRVGS